MMQSGPQLAAALAYLVTDLLNHETASGEGVAHQITTPFSSIAQADWVEAVNLWNETGRKLIRDLPFRPCPSCGENKTRPLFHSYDGYPYVECDGCGCWFVPLLVDASLFDRFFLICSKAQEVAERSYLYRQTPEFVAEGKKRFGDYFDTVIPMITNNNVDKICYLDIGCGLGTSLLVAQERGMQAMGIESSNECVQYGKSNNLSIRHVDEGFPEETFDLISLWESIEHTADPLAILSSCALHLKDHGLIAFTVPNLNSPLVRAQRADCMVVHGGYDTPGHINLYGPSHLRRIFKRAGLEVLDLDGQYGMSLSELVSYMLGKTRGANDILEGRPSFSALSSRTNVLIESIGPSVTLLERATLTSPILFGFACRTSSVGHFSDAIEELRARRKNALQEINKRDGMLSELQKEINKRDGMLCELQKEINKRDGMLSELQQSIEQLQQKSHAAQLEINKRDDMLEEEDVRLAGEIQVRDKMLRVLQETANELQQKLHEAQLEINKRDDMLHG